MKPLIQLIYNSAATCVFNNQDLENLLRGARETNTKLDVTGMLLFVDGCFFQVLEGAEDVVDRLAEKIRLDRRHSKMSIILREPITRRVFRDWSMGLMCMSTEEAGSIEGLNDFFADGKFLTQLEAGRARTILKAFGEGRWRVRLNAAEIPQPKDSPKQVTGLSENPKHTRTSTGDYSFAFQPIVDIRYKRVVSYEALVRGRANEPAFSVLKALSGQKLWAFDRDARRHAVRLAAELGLKTQLNLNLLPESIQAFGNEAMFDTIDAAVANGLRPEQIVLEVSESEAFPDFAIFLKLVHECRARGVKFAIDDFGAGHSGLNLLADFQPDSLKVDMKLVRDIASKGPRQAIIRGLLVTCSDLGIDVVAEGVETMDEFTWLRDEGVSLFQGYLFAKPLFEALPAVAFPRMAALPPLSSSETTSPDQAICEQAQSAEAH